MPDEAPQAPAEAQQDTPPEAPESAVEAPEQDTPTEQQSQAEIDYQKRYEDLRSEFDRRNQIDAALRGQFGPEVQAQVAQEVYGFEFEQDTPDEEEELPADPDERLDRIEQMLQQREEETQALQAQEAFLVDVNDGIEAVEKEIGRELSDEETQFVLAQAEAQIRSGGQLDIAAAYKPLEAMSKRYVEQYIESKKAPKAPLGAAGEQQFDLRTEEGRRAAMAAAAESALLSED